MARGMMIDVDHMSFTMKSEVIDIADEHEPPYPLISDAWRHQRRTGPADIRSRRTDLPGVA